MGTTASKCALHARDVMSRFGYRDRKSFWEFVWREGVPCVRLSARNIVFFEDTLNDWIETRSVGGRRTLRYAPADIRAFIANAKG